MAAFALLVAYVSVAAAAWNLGMSLSASMLPSLFPDDPDIAMNDAVREMREQRGLVSDDGLTRVRMAARTDPMEDEPFLFLGLRQIALGRHEIAIFMLEEARRRNPRQIDTRIFLLDEYARSGDTGAALRESVALSTLLPEARPQLVEVLINLAGRSETRDATLAALTSHPLRQRTLQELTIRGASSTQLVQLTRDLRGIAVKGNDTRWIDALIQQFVNRNDPEGARRLWRHFYGIDSKINDAGIYDGDLDGLAGSPFGWTIETGKAGIAQFRKGGLFIQHFGRGNIVFARQLVILAPGSYRLNFEGMHGQKASANLAWRIDCLESGATLLDLPFLPSSRFGVVPSNEFVVPADQCPAQWVALTGRPTEFPETRSFKLTHVSIDPAGAR